jgi:hypothetical protein
MAPVLFQPIAADDVAEAVCRTAVGSPLNGRVEVAGPEQYRMDEFFRQALAARNDPREVVTDPHARHFRTELTERSLVPLGDKPRRSPGREGPPQFPRHYRNVPRPIRRRVLDGCASRGAGSLLPGLLAATRTGLPPASDDELTTEDQLHTTCLLGARMTGG